MKSFSSKLLFIFHNLNRIFFVMDLQLIYFFADTVVGYFFYIFCIFYGFFGCTSDDCKITHSLAAIFVCFMIGLVIQTYIFVKIPFTRKYFESLVGKDYIEKYLGKYTGSESVVKIIKYVSPALILMTAETVTANQEYDKLSKAAELTEKNFMNDFKSRNTTPNDADYQEMYKVRDKYIYEAAHARGVVSRGFAASVHSFSSSDHTN